MNCGIVIRVIGVHSDQKIVFTLRFFYGGVSKQQSRKVPSFRGQQTPLRLLHEGYLGLLHVASSSSPQQSSLVPSGGQQSPTKPIAAHWGYVEQVSLTGGLGGVGPAPSQQSKNVPSVVGQQTPSRPIWRQ
jgi:hypothetical protein